MKTLFTATLLLFATGCIAYAHPQSAHHPNHVSQQMVQAWVWVPGHYTPTGSWQHNHWERRSVQRYMLSRYPRTYIRYIEGRGRPAAPLRSNRRPYRRHR